LITRRGNEMTITEKFHQFHRENPHVYQTLVAKCRQYRRHNPGAKIGIATLWENMRWDYMMSTEHQDFKLNNNYRSHYARLIMDCNHDLRDIFEIREMRAA